MEMGADDLMRWRDWKVDWEEEEGWAGLGGLVEGLRLDLSMPAE